MFEIGWSELLLIGIVALIAIGPKELPTVLRTLGQWMSKLRRMASEFQSQFQEAMREAEMADLKKQVDEMTSQAQNYASFDPVSEVKRELESTQQQIESAMVDPAGAATPIPPVAAEPTTSPAGAALPAASAPATDAAATSPRAAPARRCPPRGRRRRPTRPPPMPPSPMASPHEPRGRREGDRGDQSAADGTLGRTAFAADQGADRLRHRLCRLLLLRQDDLRRADLAVRLGGGPGLQVHLYRPARIFRCAAQARDVRRGVHIVPGGGDADLHVRRARPLSPRKAGLPALPGGDSHLLPARLCRRLCPGLADAGAIFSEHAASRRRRPRRDRAPAEGRRLSDLDDEAHLRLRHRLPAAGDPDAAGARRHPHLRSAQGEAALLHRRRLRNRGGAHAARRAQPALARAAADGAL